MPAPSPAIEPSVCPTTGAHATGAEPKANGSSGELSYGASALINSPSTPATEEEIRMLDTMVVEARRHGQQPDLDTMSMALYASRNPDATESDPAALDQIKSDVVYPLVYPGYSSQRDNTNVNSSVSADAQCSPTSLTQQLRAVSGQSEQALVDHTRALIIGVNGNPEYEQLEDLLIEYIREAVASGEYELAAWEIEQYSGGPGSADDTHHKNPYVHEWVLEQFNGLFSSVSDGTVAWESDEDWDTVRALLDTGASITMETGLSGSGHVVTVLRYDANGVWIHDPYGARLSTGYIRNGSVFGNATTDKLASARSIFRDNPELLEILAHDDTRQTETSDRWGERNYHTYASLNDYSVSWYHAVNATSDNATSAAE